MAKRASKAARVEKAEAPSLPASESPRLDAPAIDTPSSGDFASPLADVAPAEVLGSFPPQEPASSEPPSLPVSESPSLPASESPTLDSTHPAIALAQRHHTGAGAPREGAPRYLTSPPFDVFAKKKKP